MYCTYSAYLHYPGNDFWNIKSLMHPNDSLILEDFWDWRLQTIRKCNQSNSCRSVATEKTYATRKAEKEVVEFSAFINLYTSQPGSKSHYIKFACNRSTSSPFLPSCFTTVYSLLLHYFHCNITLSCSSRFSEIWAKSWQKNMKFFLGQVMSLRLTIF